MFCMGRLKKGLSNFKGFTVIEILIAMVIILLIAIVTTPLLVFTAQSDQYNRAKATAKELANEKIEEIRSMEFADIETGYEITEPPQSYDDRDYTIETYINWESQSGCFCQDQTEADWDVKSVRVVVSSEGYFPGKDTVKEEAHTLIARDYEQSLYQGATLGVCSFSGWEYMVDGKKKPVQGNPVSIFSNSNTQKVISTDTGASLFLDIDPGTYTVEISPNEIDMVAFPGSFPKTDVAISEGITKRFDAYIEVPGNLDISLKNIDDEPIVINDPDFEATIVLEEPYGGIDDPDDNPSREIAETFTQTDDDGNIFPDDIFIDLWPFHENHANAYSFKDYEIPGYKAHVKGVWDDQLDDRWQGYFDGGPGSTKELIIYLWKIPEFDKGAATDWLREESVTIDHNLEYDERIAYDAYDDKILKPGIFNRDKKNDSYHLTANENVDFIATQFYFRGTDLGIKNSAELLLHGNYYRFENAIEIRDTGTIVLNTLKVDDYNVDDDYDLLIWPDLSDKDSGDIEWDCLVPAAPEEGIIKETKKGSDIDAPAEQSNTEFGIVYFENDVYKGPSGNNELVISEGAYYFPDGFCFLSDYDKSPEEGGLIRITE